MYDSEEDKKVTFGVLLLSMILIAVFVLKILTWALYEVWVGEKQKEWNKIKVAMLRDIMFMVITMCVVAVI